MGILTKKVSLEEADLLFKKTMAALENEHCPLASLLIKTLEGLQPTLAKESTEFLQSVNKMVKEHTEEGKPIFNEGFTEEDYINSINENKNKEIEISIHTAKPTDNHILPNGTRIRIIDYLEKGTAINAKVYMCLTENYIQK